MTLHYFGTISPNILSASFKLVWNDRSDGKNILSKGRPRGCAPWTGSVPYDPEYILLIGVKFTSTNTLQASSRNALLKSGKTKITMSDLNMMV